MNSLEDLICRIFEQAIEDYRYLNDNQMTQDKDSSSHYSIKDIEIFFGSNWCARLLDMIGCQLTGKDILAKIKAQCA